MCRRAFTVRVNFAVRGVRPTCSSDYSCYSRQSALAYVLFDDIVWVGVAAMVISWCYAVFRLRIGNEVSRAAHSTLPAHEVTGTPSVCGESRRGLVQESRAWRKRLMFRHSAYVLIFVVCWIWPVIHHTHCFKSDFCHLMGSIGVTSQVC